MDARIWVVGIGIALVTVPLWYVIVRWPRTRTPAAVDGDEVAEDDTEEEDEDEEDDEEIISEEEIVTKVEELGVEEVESEDEERKRWSPTTKRNMTMRMTGPYGTCRGLILCLLRIFILDESVVRAQ